MHEILAIDGPGLMGSGTEQDPHYELYYFEGNSPMVDVLDNTPGAGGWFSFEEPLALGCFYLNLRLGFTVEQIMMAIKESEARV